jgi:hypothetical protein
MLQWNRQRRENWDIAVEDAVGQLAMGGNDQAAELMQHPILLQMLKNRLRIRSAITKGLGDGKLLDRFKDLVDYLLENSDKILAVIVQLIALFI